MEFINHKLNIKCYTCLNSTAWSLHVQAMDICLFYMNLLQLLHCDALRLRFICDAFPCTFTLASQVVKSGWKVLSRIYSRNMSTGYYGIYYPLRSDVRAHFHDISFWLWHLLLLRSSYAFFRTRRFLIILRTQARTIFMNLIL